MNHREPPHPAAAVRQVLMCLVVLPLTALTPHRVNAISRRPVIVFVPRTVETAPYLPINGAPPLRFADVPVAPKVEVIASLSTGTPPLTPETLETAAAGTTQTDAATSPARSEAPSVGGTTPDTSSAAPAPAAKSPAPILPDDVRPTVRAEDFLPYFQIPGSARNPGDVTLIVPGIKTPPAPGTLPPSSATYTQSPK